MKVLDRFDVRDVISEAVVSFERGKKKRELQAFEALVRPFLDFWDGGADALLKIQLNADDPGAQHMAHLTKNFIQAGKDLSVFLRGRRLKMMKTLR